MKYRLLAGKHGRFEVEQSVIYRKGDELDLSAAEAESLGNRVEKIGASEPAAEAPNGADAGSLGLAGVNMPKAVDLVSKLDSSEALDAAGEEEKAGKDRKGVHEAIEARRAGLGG